LPFCGELYLPVLARKFHTHTRYKQDWQRVFIYGTAGDKKEALHLRRGKKTVEIKQRRCVIPIAAYSKASAVGILCSVLRVIPTCAQGARYEKKINFKRKAVLNGQELEINAFSGPQRLFMLRAFQLKNKKTTCF